MATQFEYLYTPLKIGPVTVRNRIVSSPHATCLADADGMVTERQIDYHTERARGGVGLIILGTGYVHPTGKVLPGMNNLYDARVVPGLRRLAEAVHRHGAVLFGQQYHVGGQFRSDFTELPLWAPSTLPHPVSPEIPHEMEIEEIEELVDYEARVARHYREAGFDGVEVCMCHGRLLGQFLSPFSNRRTDEYGGSFEGRLRIALEVIDRVREAVGEDRVVGVRISGDEFTDGGLTLKDMQEIAPRLEATGKINYLHVSQSGIESFHTQVPDMHTPTGAFVYLAAGIKESLQELPVVAVTRINDPLLAEKILAEGHADLITMNRATICDPEMPLKAREGRLDDIRTCIACNQGCLDRVLKALPIRCLQNAAVGREGELGMGTLQPAPQKKRVLVVGGGPAGMEAARVAAERGHRVSLYEKEEELGGQARIAARVPRREELGGITRFLSAQLKRLGVDLHLGVEATGEVILQEAPDAVIVATGSVPSWPALPGLDRERVFLVEDVLLGRAKVGKRVLVVDDGEGHWKSCGVAELLADQGRQVEILTPLLHVGHSLEETSLEHFYHRVRALGVVFTPMRVLKGMAGEMVRTMDVYSREEIEIEGVDTVVLSRGREACNALYRSLKGKVKELHWAGDCLAPRKAMDAIREGHLVGRAV